VGSTDSGNIKRADKKKFWYVINYRYDTYKKQDTRNRMDDEKHQQNNNKQRETTTKWFIIIRKIRRSVGLKDEAFLAIRE
jgi:hypothetical protein